MTLNPTMEPTTPNQTTLKILKVLSQQLGVDQSVLTPQADLANDLNLQDLELVDLGVSLGETLKITVDPEEAAGWETVSDIINSLAEKISAQTPNTNQ